jgi:hypothetical protein
MADVLLLAGSPQEGSRSTFVLDHSRAFLEQAGLQVERLAVRELPPEDLVYGRYDSAAIRAASARIATTRGLIIATRRLVRLAEQHGQQHAHADIDARARFASEHILAERITLEAQRVGSVVKHTACAGQ